MEFLFILIYICVDNDDGGGQVFFIYWIIFFKMHSFGHWYAWPWFFIVVCWLVGWLASVFMLQFHNISMIIINDDNDDVWLDFFSFSFSVAWFKQQQQQQKTNTIGFDELYVRFFSGSLLLFWLLFGFSSFNHLFFLLF